VPLFLSRNQLATRKTLPKATTTFALDSGGFTELQKHGRWSLPENAYADYVTMLRSVYGKRLEWVAPQDWMCEPVEGTGLSAHRRIAAGGSSSVNYKEQAKIEDPE
jgi:hypothetical protein